MMISTATERHEAQAEVKRLTGVLERITTDDLVARLRAMAKGQHDDHSIGDEAADERLGGMMRLWTPEEVQRREQQLVTMCARIAVEYGPQHPFQSSTTEANGIARVIEGFGRMVKDEWAVGGRDAD